MKLLYTVGLITLITQGALSQPAELLDMNTAINVAVQNNPGLKASYQQIPAAKGNLKENIVPEGPQIGVDYDDAPGDFGQRIYYAQQNIEFPLRYYYGYKAFDEQVSSAEAGYARDVFYLKLQTRNAYLDWLQAWSKLRVAEKTFDVSDDFFTQATRLYDAGEIGRIEFTRSEINLTQSQLLLDGSRNNEAMKRSALLTMMGMPASSIIKPADSLTGLVSITRNNFKTLFDSMIQTDIALAMQNIERYRTELNWQRSGYLPDIILKVFKPAGEPDIGFGFGFIIPVWIFNQQGAVQEAKANYTASQYTYQQRMLEISNQWYALQSVLQLYDSRLTQYYSLLILSRQMLDDARTAYNAGELSYLQYLDGQQAYLQSQNQLIGMEYTYLVTVTEYYKIAGGL
ncbi:MAG: TolC family protein [Bacteroidota bacterium]|nr:TolC family protein [Bacteroidota bacterium]